MGPAALAAALALPLLLAFGPGLAVPAGAQDAARRAALRERLQATLLRLSTDLDGVPGYLMRDLASGESLERNADVVFPVASVVKLPVLLELYRQAEEGTLDLARPVPIDPKARVEGGGVLEKWSAPYPDLSAAQLAVLMMDFSDNYATNLLIDLVGPDRVGRRLKGWGFKETLLRRKMMDLDAARAGRENVSTPREMAALLERLGRGQFLDADGTGRVIAIMKRNERTPLKRALPAGVESARRRALRRRHRLRPGGQGARLQGARRRPPRQRGSRRGHPTLRPGRHDDLPKGRLRRRRLHHRRHPRRLRLLQRPRLLVGIRPEDRAVV